MFDEIRGDLRNQPRVGAVLVLTAITMTILLNVSPSLEQIFGVHNNLGSSFTTRMTVPFVHGYNEISSWISLFINLVLMYFIGSFLEKILGGFRFIIAALLSYVLYILIHRWLLLMGNGFTPFIMTFSGIMFTVIFEGRYVKTNTVFDYYYKTLWFFQFSIWIVLPFLFTLIPIYFDANYSLSERILFGNICNVSCGLLGILLGLIFRNHIRKKLVQRTRKKYIKHENKDDYAWVLALGFPMFLALKFFFL